MGRAKKFKLLRRQSKTLPTETTVAVFGKPIMGHELIKEKEITEVEGQKVVPDKMYREKQGVPVAVNHYRKLKKAYNKGKIEGMQEYAQGVHVRHHISNMMTEEARKATEAKAELEKPES